MECLSALAALGPVAQTLPPIARDILNRHHEGMPLLICALPETVAVQPPALLFLPRRDYAAGTLSQGSRFRSWGATASKFSSFALGCPKLGAFNRSDKLTTHWLSWLHLSERLIADLRGRILSESVC
jgi:hypothetical protein